MMDSTLSKEITPGLTSERSSVISLFPVSQTCLNPKNRCLSAVTCVAD